MKAAPFGYVRPGSVDGVVAELAAGSGSGEGPGGGSGDGFGGDGFGDEVKILAGGQSLMPVLAMRLGRPDTLVDINAVPELAGIAVSGGRVVIGATVRQRAALEHPATAAVPLLRMALPWVGHREIRGRGTVCGSLAHADPAAELPAVACCLGATMRLVSARGRRDVPAADFFAGALTTVLAPDELLESVSFPVAAPADGFGFAEVARRHGDFALAGVAVRVRDAAPGRPEAVASCFGVADRPVIVDVSDWTNEVVSSVNASAGNVSPGSMGSPGEVPLFGAALRERFAAGAGDFAADVVATGDSQGSTGYRRRLIRALIAAELTRATARSLEGTA